MGSPSDRWKRFERLVAAVHQAAGADSDVRWDEVISGRQFDVVIRFRQGLHEYLTVVECKDYNHAVPVHEVEAFVTKSRDVHAHKAVMASSSGFQSGAQEVASKHNITLIEIADSAEIDPSIFGARWAGVTPVFHIQTIELEYHDGEAKRLPEEGNRLTYYGRHVIIQVGSRQQTLESAIHMPSPEDFKELEEYREFVIPCEADARVIGPADGEIPLKPLSRIRIRAGLSEARILDGPRMFDPNLLAPDVIVRDVATGEEKSFKRSGLKLGFKTKFAQGCFYGQPEIGHYFYCYEIKDNVARLYLVESFQLGELIQAEITVEARHANYYVPVTDEPNLKRLRLRLEELENRLRHEGKLRPDS